MAKTTAKKKPVSKPAAAKKPKAAKATEPKAIKDNTTTFTLEDGLDIPPRARVGGSRGDSMYPFASMAIGQSFAVPAVKVNPDDYKDEKEARKAQDEENRKVANRMSGATRRFTKQNEGYKFVVRTVGNGVRVWRTEGAE